MTLMLRAWHRQSEGRMGEAEDLLREAMALQEELPFGFGPPYPSKPAIEALADLLLEAGRNEEAAALYERSLERTLNRRLSVQGLSAARATADS
jgi:ATP/maltotriose-dependent transcriptional regulator MalT